MKRCIATAVLATIIALPLAAGTVPKQPTESPNVAQPASPTSPVRVAIEFLRKRLGRLIPNDPDITLPKP